MPDINHMTTTDDQPRQPLKCFGCDGPHAWSKKQEDGTYTIMCPNAKNAGVLDTAKANIDAMTARLKARRKGR